MKKASVILLLAYTILLSGNVFAYQELKSTPITIITAEGKYIRYNVELAVRKHERKQGLQDRTRLDEEKGMLFLYPKNSKVTMWMKDTKIPLDMIFISETGDVVKVKKEAEPGSEEHISSGSQVRAILELAAGQAEEHNIGFGSLIVELKDLLKREDIE